MTRAPIRDKYTTEWKMASMLDDSWGDLLLGSSLQAQTQATRLGADESSWSWGNSCHRS
jgi:hypothetical protein